MRDVNNKNKRTTREACLLSSFRIGLILFFIVLVGGGCVEKPNVGLMDAYVFNRPKKEVVWLETADKPVDMMDINLPSRGCSLRLAASMRANEERNWRCPLEVVVMAYPSEINKSVEISPESIQVMASGHAMELMSHNVRRSQWPTIEIWATACYSDSLLRRDGSGPDQQVGEDYILIDVSKAIKIDGEEVPIDPIVGRLP